MQNQNDTTENGSEGGDDGDCVPIEWLSPGEVDSILMNFAKTRGNKGFREEEVTGILNEFIRARAESAMLDKIISGDLKCDWNGSEIVMSLADKHRKPDNA